MTGIRHAASGRDPGVPAVRRAGPARERIGRRISCIRQACGRSFRRGQFIVDIVLRTRQCMGCRENHGSAGRVRLAPRLRPSRSVRYRTVADSAGGVSLTVPAPLSAPLCWRQQARETRIHKGASLSMDTHMRCALVTLARGASRNQSSIGSLAE